MGPRKHFLDWLRVIAFALLIVFHVGALYATFDYNLKSPHISGAVDWALLTFSPWRMALLFLISGVASRFLIDKLGAGGFARDRLRRLVPVILIGMFVVIPPQTYVELVSKGATQLGYFDFWLGEYLPADQTLVTPLGKTMPTWDHLWFIVYLLVYTLGLALVMKLRGAGARAAAKPLPNGALLAAPPLALIVANLAIEHAAPITHALIDDWGGHLKWLAMFGVGAICARQNGFWEFVRARRVTLLAIAAICLAAQMACRAYWLTGQMDPLWDGVLWGFATSLYSWFAICALAGFAYAHLDKPSPLLNHLNEAILPVYVLHQPILLIAAYFLFPLDLPGPAEALSIFAITGFGAFAIYETLIRPLAPMRFLFGLKPRTAAAAA
jgi:glucans biosynthesis protein C